MPVVVAISLVSGGFGHGSYVAARIVLPFACAAMGDYAGAPTLVSALAFLEWPLYGLLIDMAKQKGLVLAVIFVAHIGICLLLFRLWTENYG